MHNAMVGLVGDRVLLRVVGSCKILILLRMLMLRNVSVNVKKPSFASSHFWCALPLDSKADQSHCLLQ